MNLLRLITNRRRMIAASSLGLAAVTAAGVTLAGGGSSRHTSGGRLPTVPGQESDTAGADAAGLSFLQVVAHPDDDLYFINPGVQRVIGQGATVTTVIVTAGEGDGINVDTDDPDRARTPVDYAGYSAARHNGHRAAYARMATGSADSHWTVEAVALAGGLKAELCTLTDHPNVRLWFLNIRKREQPYAGILELWSGTVPSMDTLPVPGSPVKDVQTLSRDQVVEALVDLIKRAAPHVVRTLDPDPEHDPKQSGLVSSDHRDHTAVAQFTLRAVTTYRDATGAAPVVDHYRGYANRFWPYNLSPADVSAKADLIATYSGADGRPCPAHDCGDYQLGPDPVRSTHIHSTKLRHEPTTDWLVRDADGRLALFAVLAGRVVGWQEKTAGRGDWSGPAVLDEGRAGGWMLPAVSAVSGPDGKVHLIGLRRTEGPGGGAVLDVVRAVRERSAKAFGPWESLGNPDSGAQEQREVGVPAAAVDGDGQLHVFVRTFSQGMAVRVLGRDGAWRPWQDLGGSGLQDGVTAFTGRDGRVQAYAPGKQDSRRWAQPQVGGALGAAEPIPTGPVASGRLTVLEDGGGSPALVYHRADTAEVQLLRRPSPTGSWPKQPAALGGADGTGPVAGVWLSGHGALEMLLVRLGADLTAHSLMQGAGVQAPWLRAAALTVVRGAALTTSHDNRPVLALLGADGHPRVARYDTGSGAFGDWKVL